MSYSLIKSADIFINTTKDMISRPGDFDQETNEFNNQILEKSKFICDFSKTYDQIITHDNYYIIVTNFANIIYNGIGSSTSNLILRGVLEYFCEQHFNYQEMFEDSEEPKQSVTKKISCTLTQTFDLATGKPESQSLELHSNRKWVTEPNDNVNYFMGNDLDKNNLLMPDEKLEHILLPKQQTDIVIEALQFKKDSINVTDNHLAFKSFDLETLICMFKYRTEILLSKKEKELFSFSNTVDFPQYSYSKDN